VAGRELAGDGNDRSRIEVGVAARSPRASSTLEAALWVLEVTPPPQTEAVPGEEEVASDGRARPSSIGEEDELGTWFLAKGGCAARERWRPVNGARPRSGERSGRGPGGWQERNPHREASPDISKGSRSRGGQGKPSAIIGSVD